MGVSVYQDVFRSPKVYEPFHGFEHVPSFFGAGIKFAVRISACSAFSKAIIRFRMYYLLFIYGCQISSSSPNILATLKYNGLVASLHSPKCCIEPSWSSAYNGYFFLGIYLARSPILRRCF